MESSFDVSDQDVSVFNIDVEFLLQGFVNMNTGGDICITFTVSEVSFESNWHRIPTGRVNLAKAFSNGFDTSFCGKSRLSE